MTITTAMLVIRLLTAEPEWCPTPSLYHGEWLTAPCPEEADR